MNRLPALKRRRPLFLGRKIQCRDCHGTGAVVCGYPDEFGWAEYSTGCVECRGTGGVWVSRLYPRQPPAPEAYGPTAPDWCNVLADNDIPF